MGWMLSGRLRRGLTRTWTKVPGVRVRCSAAVTVNVQARALAPASIATQCRVGVSSSPSIVHCLITWPSNSAKPGSPLGPGQSPRGA